MPRFRIVVLPLAVALLTSGCALVGDVGFARLTVPASPAASPGPPPGEPPACAPKPVGFTFLFVDAASAEDQAILREAMDQARQRYPLEFTRKAIWSPFNGRYVCQPKQHVERIATTVHEAEDDEAGFYVGGKGIRLYLDPSWWPTAGDFRYRLMYHEAYHWYQEMSVRSYARTSSRQELYWMVEGSALWAEFDAAVHFGNFPSMDEARAREFSRLVNANEELSHFENGLYDDPQFDAYPFFFKAVDYLMEHHGGRAAMRRYWEYAGPDDKWREIFQSAFGISVKKFYKEFAAA